MRIYIFNQQSAFINLVRQKLQDIAGRDQNMRKSSKLLQVRFGSSWQPCSIVTRNNALNRKKVHDNGIRQSLVDLVCQFTQTIPQINICSKYKLYLQYFKGELMGSEQPKPVAKAAKAQIDIAALKARIHLELFRDRKNTEVVKVQKELLQKIKSKNRNKTEELLIAERVVLGLKYAAACNLLIGYASNIRLQAQFISDNMFNQKIEPFLVMIYSLIYAADHLGLSSLAEFKNLMKALNNPIALDKYLNPEIVSALAPTPTPEELNIYMLEFSDRNEVSLEEINAAGHRFTRDWKHIPSLPPNGIPSNFTDIQNRLAEDLGNKIKGPGGQGPNNQAGNGGNGLGGGGNGIGGGGIGGGFNPYQQLDPKQLINNAGNNNFDPNSNPYNNPNSNPYNNPNSNPYNLNNFGPGNNGPAPNNTPANLGPNFYVPPEIAPKNKGQEVRQSITSINDIDYYPEIDANPVIFNKGGFVDPDFDKICERLKKGL